MNNNCNITQREIIFTKTTSLIYVNGRKKESLDFDLEGVMDFSLSELDELIKVLGEIRSHLNKTLYANKQLRELLGANVVKNEKKKC
jgi:hypothetical protein